MPVLLLRLVIFLAVGFCLVAVVTPALWGPVLVKQATHILSPFMILSTAIFVGSVGYAWAHFRKKP
jgi:hypothetical protein